MKKREKIIMLVIIIGIVAGISVKYLVNSRYDNLQENNSNHIEDTKEKRQNVKVAPIETTEVVKENQQDNDENTESKTDNTKNEENKVFEQEIQVEPTTPEYTQVDNLPKVLSVEEPTTSIDMKIPEIIHDELTTETTTKK